MSEILDNVNNLLKQTDVADRYSLFQLQCFILGKEPTIQGKLHQCLRELKIRKKTIEAIEMEIEDQKDQLELLELQKMNIIEKREAEIHIRRTERKKTQISNHIREMDERKKNCEEECLFFLSAFDQLSKREALKQWDDPEMQKQYWDEKYRNEVNLRLLLRQLPDIETMRSIMALHDDSLLKKKLIAMLGQQDAKSIENKETKD